MLLRRRDVALRAVCEFNVKGRRERALRLQLQTGDRKNFVRDRRDAEVADAQGLQLQFSLRTRVEMDRFARVNLRLRLRQTVAEFRCQLLRPRETRLVGHAEIQRQRAFRHAQRRGILPLDAAIRLDHARGDGLRVGVVADVARWCAVIHPHLIAARALRHDAHEPRIRAQRLGEMLREAAEVIRRDERRAVVVHRVIRQHRERTPIRRLHREQ